MSTFSNENNDLLNQDAAPLGVSPSPEMQKPLLADEGMEDLDVFEIPRSKKHSQLGVSMLVLVGAAGVIFAMRQFGMGTTASFAGIELNYEPAADAPKISAKKVLNDLDRSRHALQVPSRFITHDPFELEVAKDAPKTNDSISRVEAERKKRAEALKKEREAHARQIQNAYDNLHLQSCVNGKIPMARINNKIVKIGMSVGEYFQVIAISGRQVILRADDKEFTLSLDDPNIKTGSRRYH